LSNLSGDISSEELARGSADFSRELSKVWFIG
jgi:hypothetical protein